MNRKTMFALMSSMTRNNPILVIGDDLETYDGIVEGISKESRICYVITFSNGNVIRITDPELSGNIVLPKNADF